MSEQFAGLDVVITGGTGALGRAVVEQLLQRGARCQVPVLDKAGLGAFPYRDHPRLTIVPGVNLADEESARSFYAGCPPLWASIQLAGGFQAGLVAATSAQDFVKMLNLNALTCFLSCREAVGRIRAGARGGRIVNVSARAALSPSAGSIAYSVSKAAVAAITTSLAAELAPERIWVNAVVPSIMDTPANRAAMPEADHDRWPKLDEVASTIVFLASPDNLVTHGALVPVYGQS